MSLGLPRGVLWYPAAAAMAAALGVTGFVQKAFRIENITEKTRGWLNDGELVDLSARRLYVYSTVDKLVGWRDVEEHAQEARERGVEVRLLKEEDTPHVQHVFKDAEIYWEKVVSLWGKTA